MKNRWNIDSWKQYRIQQQPIYDDIDVLNLYLVKLKNLPSLVFSGETRVLLNQLQKINNNKFVLQIGDCCESFTDCHGPKIHNYLRIFLQMANIIEYETGVDVIKIGRIAGQYAKPRSSDFEYIESEKIPTYRGDIISDYEPTLEKRKPNAKRLLDGYFHSVATLNLIRAFINGGYGEINNISDWEKHFYYSELKKLDYYQNFKDTLKNSFNLKKLSNKDNIFISHEALLLDYESAFARIDTTTNEFYCTSAHTIWVGERTRQFDSAHIEFVSGLQNPIGIKIGPEFDVKEIVNVIKKINVNNIIGKVMLITRMGFNIIETKLNELQNAIKKYNLNVIWICDPMHGNTFTHKKFKVRNFENIVSEIKSFFKVSNNNGIIPGGVHLEITSEYVSECVGGINGLSLDDIPNCYVTKVDPRLNTSQCLEIAFIINQLLKTYKLN